LHSTREWSANELGFFKVHIFAVPPDDWSEYITPNVQLMTEKAQQLANCELSAGAFSSGAHLVEGMPDVVEEFGDTINIIYNHNSAKPGVDRLAHILLHACNPDRRMFIDVPQMKQISVKVPTNSSVVIEILVCIGWNSRVQEHP
jgi:hypothetical protein